MRCLQLEFRTANRVKHRHHEAFLGRWPVVWVETQQSLEELKHFTFVLSVLLKELIETAFFYEIWLDTRLLYWLEVQVVHLWTYETLFLFTLQADDLYDFGHLVIGAYNVVLGVRVEKHFFAGAQRKAGHSFEENLEMFLSPFTVAFVWTAHQLGEHASHTPHIYFEIVGVLAQDHLRCPIPPGSYLHRKLPLLSPFFNCATYVIAILDSLIHIFRIQICKLLKFLYCLIIQFIVIWIRTL